MNKQDLKEILLWWIKKRQNAKKNIEKIFHKLMNNGNLGHDCRNNANNSTFQPIIDEVNEITYIKNNYSLIDSKVSNFVNSDLLEKEMEQNFQQKVENIKNVALFKNAKVPTLNHQRSDDKDALECRKKMKKRKRRSDVSF